jgi:hypothetical protein
MELSWRRLCQGTHWDADKLLRYVHLEPSMTFFTKSWKTGRIKTNGARNLAGRLTFDLSFRPLHAHLSCSGACRINIIIKVLWRKNCIRHDTNFSYRALSLASPQGWEYSCWISSIHEAVFSMCKTCLWFPDPKQYQTSYIEAIVQWANCRRAISCGLEDWNDETPKFLVSSCGWLSNSLRS